MKTKTKDENESKHQKGSLLVLVGFPPLFSPQAWQTTNRGAYSPSPHPSTVASLAWKTLHKTDGNGGSGYRDRPSNCAENGPNGG